MTRGNRRDPTVTGDLAMDVLLTGMDSRGVSLGKLYVYGTARGASVRSLGSMSRLQMGATDGSDFLAGIDGGVARYADSQADFTNPLATIGSVKVKGLRLPRGVPAPRFVADTNFSAATIGAVGLLNIDYDNDSDAFGFFALGQGTGSEIKSVKSVDTVTGERWSWPDPSQVFARPDMVIQII
jgi:hypothetical protein